MSLAKVNFLTPLDATGKPEVGATAEADKRLNDWQPSTPPQLNFLSPDDVHLPLKKPGVSGGASFDSGRTLVAANFTHELQQVALADLLPQALPAQLASWSALPDGATPAPIGATDTFSPAAVVDSDSASASIFA